MAYTTRVSLSSTTTPTDYVFRGNGPFDPDFTGTGGQPVNYDDYSSQYDQYRVWGSSISMTCVASSSLNLLMGPNHASTALTSASLRDSFASNPYVKKRMVNVNGSGIESPIESRMSTPKFSGITTSGFQGDSTFASAYTTVPANQWFWHICTQHVDLSSAAILYADVTITYDVEWYDRVESFLDLKSRITRFKSSINPPKMDAWPGLTRSNNGILITDFDQAILDLEARASKPLYDRTVPLKLPEKIEHKKSWADQCEEEELFSSTSLSRRPPGSTAAPLILPEKKERKQVWVEV